MNCLDTSALVDYLHGNDAMAAFLDATEQRPLFAPTVALHEVFVGGARLRGAGGVEDAREDLDWVEPLELTVEGAAEAALIEAELEDGGAKIGPMDTLIAGVVREAGGTLVTRDSHFDRVAGLEVQRY
ncbi:PIN domain-containing protein [Haloarcula salinisoli]|uniref:Ribonuclease VapC n=1 Tax=Haloarcula salinisoli TaxID=2487746 RepID=A0A8J7YER0_9EURY|nr:PIN domain-containing protein [Halomicroarcula salinisoli]MBX0286817.1 PIN domain-containing protein [Halomicroarcula salinisoli]MBX0304117.1 PIN domain-containing protein [Halomicroarcula salinisoli]